jgi:hypothetical protein
MQATERASYFDCRAHQTTTREMSRQSLRILWLKFCRQQSGTTALVSQDALTAFRLVLIALGSDHRFEVCSQGVFQFRDIYGLHHRCS